MKITFNLLIVNYTKILSLPRSLAIVIFTICKLMLYRDPCITYYTPPLVDEQKYKIKI